VDAALPRARQLHLREVVAEGLIVLAGVAWSRGDHDGCEARAQEGLLLANGPQFALQRARLLLPLTSVQATRGQLASAASGLSEAQLLFKDLRNRHSRALALANLAEVLLSQGDVQGAWTHATEALEEARTAGYRVGEVAAQEIRGHAALVVGATEVATREFRASLALTREMGRPAEGLTAEMLLGRLALENNQPDAASAHLDAAARCADGYDPEHYLPLIHALRAQALGRRALTLPETSGARSALAELAWGACKVAEEALGGLPLMRKAQATLDVARARAILGDFEGALPRARAAAHLSSMRGFRLVTLDALAVAAFVTADEEERARLTAEVADWVVEVAPCIPLAWHTGFRQRLGLPPDA
jgi:tetratricopeptide (TPR) repeat protein